MELQQNRRWVYSEISSLANRLQAAGDRVAEDITSKQLALLRAIAEMPQTRPTMTQVARYIGSTRQNVTKMLEQLALKRYVAITTLPQDRRGQGVALTAKAKERMAAMSQADGDFLSDAFAGLDRDRLEVLAQTIDTIQCNLDRMRQEAEEEAARLAEEQQNTADG